VDESLVERDETSVEVDETLVRLEEALVAPDELLVGFDEPLVEVDGRGGSIPRFLVLERGPGSFSQEPVIAGALYPRLLPFQESCGLWR
jgi:hypothetical protein